MYMEISLKPKEVRIALPVNSTGGSALFPHGHPDRKNMMINIIHKIIVYTKQ